MDEACVITALLVEAEVKKITAPHQVARYITERMDAFRALHERGVSLQREIAESRRVYEETRKRLEAELAALSKECPHYQQTHRHDASGNGDNDDSCDTCGAWL